jgi:hypothetical protein
MKKARRQACFDEDKEVRHGGDISPSRLPSVRRFSRAIIIPGKVLQDSGD